MVAESKIKKIVLFSTFSQIMWSFWSGSLGSFYSYCIQEALSASLKKLEREASLISSTKFAARKFISLNYLIWNIMRFQSFFYEIFYFHYYLSDSPKKYKKKKNKYRKKMKSLSNLFEKDEKLKWNGNQENKQKIIKDIDMQFFLMKLEKFSVNFNISDALRRCKK
jgi:hypothetical protein